MYRGRIVYLVSFSWLPNSSFLFLEFSGFRFSISESESSKGLTGFLVFRVEVFPTSDELVDSQEDSSSSSSDSFSSEKCFFCFVVNNLSSKLSKKKFTLNTFRNLWMSYLNTVRDVVTVIHYFFTLLTRTFKSVTVHIEKKIKKFKKWFNECINLLYVIEYFP